MVCFVRVQPRLHNVVVAGQAGGWELAAGGVPENV